jgi:hypothetical protein
MMTTEKPDPAALIQRHFRAVFSYARCTGLAQQAEVDASEAAPTEVK